MNTNKSGFAITSLVIGILSMTILCLGGSLLGTIGLIFGIVSLCRHEIRKGIAISGIITSCLGILIGIFLIIALLFIRNVRTNQILDEVDSMIQDDTQNAPFDDSSSKDSVDVFCNNHFESGDESMIYFEDDGTFIWYQSDSNHEDNYYIGTYDVYNADNAVTCLTEELTEYGVTPKEMEDYFARNADSDYYTKENFYVLILHNKQLVTDGIEQSTSSDTPYMGFYVDGYYDCTNMNTANYASFTLQE